MTTVARIAALIALLSPLTSSPIAAQSLAELAAQEKLRRAALAQQAAAEGASPPKVYTNDDLRRGGRLTLRTGEQPSVGETEIATEPDRVTTELDREPGGVGTEPTASAQTDETQWRNRMGAARQALERAELLAEALQNRVDSLWADFTGRDDPAQRTVIEQERQAALDELGETRAQVDNLTQEIADIRTAARRASVPPGWLR